MRPRADGAHELSLDDSAAADAIVFDRILIATGRAPRTEHLGLDSVLTRRGFAVDPLGMTVTIAIGGPVLAVEPRYSSVLVDARFYALLLGVISLANFLLAVLAGEDLPNSQRNP